MLLQLILALFTVFMASMIFVNLGSYFRQTRKQDMPSPVTLLGISVLVSIILIYGTLYGMGYMEDL